MPDSTTGCTGCRVKTCEGPNRLLSPPLLVDHKPIGAGPLFLSRGRHVVASADRQVKIGLLRIVPLKLRPTADFGLTWQRHSPTSITVTAPNASNAFLLVFNEAYHPEWRATIDGQALPHVIVNGVANGWIVPSLPAGGSIVLTFAGQPYYVIAAAISAIALIIFDRARLVSGAMADRLRQSGETVGPSAGRFEAPLVLRSSPASSRSCWQHTFPATRQNASRRRPISPRSLPQSHWQSRSSYRGGSTGTARAFAARVPNAAGVALGIVVFVSVVAALVSQPGGEMLALAAGFGLVALAAFARRGTFVPLNARLAAALRPRSLRVASTHGLAASFGALMVAPLLPDDATGIAAAFGYRLFFVASLLLLWSLLAPTNAVAVRATKLHARDRLRRSIGT